MSHATNDSSSPRLPSWLQKPPGSAAETFQLKTLLRSARLNTVCEEARCPNISECFSRGSATFMILGDICTRGCRFCAVRTGKPSMSPQSFEAEAFRVAQAAAELALRHVVVTSVARDDLSDGGAQGFYATIKALRSKIPGVTVEVLIPDFRGSKEALEKVITAGPDVLNHNLETVARLYRTVRPGTKYQRSLTLLRYAKLLEPKLTTKTGIMLGLGEKKEEVVELMNDARNACVEIFTAGQYLQPTKMHLPVHAYLPLAEFAWYKQQAEDIGFKRVAIGPLVRSSYHADELA